MKRAPTLLPALVAALFGVAVFGPGLGDAATHFLGQEHTDAWGTQWFYWYVGRQLAAGEPLGHTDLLFHPWGKEVYLHTGANVLDAALAWPLRAALGPVAGYDVFVLLLVATNGWAARSLLRGQGVRPFAADLGAVLFAFNPFTLLELRDGRPTQALLAFFLLFWRDYLALDRDRRLRRPALAGLWLALTGLTYWYYALFAGLAAGGVALWRARRRAGGLARHAAAGAVALLAVAPFALPMARAADVPGLLDLSTWTLTTWRPTTLEGVDIGLYVFDPRRWVSGFYALAEGGGLTFYPGDRTVLGVQVALAAAGLALAPRGKVAVPAILLAVAFSIALGPVVDLGADVPNGPYLALVWAVKAFRRLWWPSRALVLAQIGLVLLAGWALSRVAKRAVLGPIVGLLVAGVWAWELERASLLPMARWSAAVPDAYRCLADAQDGAVLELPYAHTQAHLYYQAVHGRPIFGGMVEDNPVFAPPEQARIRRENGFVGALIDVAAGERVPRQVGPMDKQALRDLGYRWVLLDQRAYTAPDDGAGRRGASHGERLRGVRRGLSKLAGAPVYEDDVTVLYAPWGDDSPCPDRAGTRADRR